MIDKYFLYRNPFILFCLTYIFCLFLYQLEWASIYPKLGNELKILFVITFISYSLISIKFQTSSKFTIKENFYLPVYYDLSGILLIFVEFLFFKEIPLLSTINGNPSRYDEFGLPIIHILAYCLLFCTSIIRFNQYLLTNKKKYLLSTFFSILIFILIMNRAAIMLLIFCCFSSILLTKKIKLASVLKMFFSMFLILLIFGCLGNLRSGSSIIESSILPTEKFYDLSISSEILWAYTYFTSPFSNLQNTVTISEPKYDFVSFFVSEILPETIGKRIAPLLGISDIFYTEVPLVVENLNVSTALAKSYFYAGWIGIFLLLSYMAIFAILVDLLSRKNPLRIPIISIVNSMFVFSFFTNFFKFSGTIISLILMFFLSKKIRYSKTKIHRG